MEVSDETLWKSFRNMSDEELTRRWQVQLFTDEAWPIAKAEIDARGLDVSADAFARVQAQDREDTQAIKRRQVATTKRMLVRLVLGIMGVAASAIAALVLGGH